MEDLKGFIYQLREWSDRLEQVENEIDAEIANFDTTDDLEMMAYNTSTDISTMIHTEKWELRRLADRLEEVFKDEG